MALDTQIAEAIAQLQGGDVAERRAAVRQAADLLRRADCADPCCEQLLAALRNQATAAGDRPLVAFVDDILALLDAGGNPAGLGGELAGVYAIVWQTMVERLTGRGRMV